MSRTPADSGSNGLEELLRMAHAAANDAGSSAVERAEMLVEIAMGLQRRPKTPRHLTSAVELYEQALSLCPHDAELLRARITARKGTALQAVPEQGTASLERARAAYEQAIPVLNRLGTPEEIAEAEMNHGLVLQYLASCGRAAITEAIAAYQRALRTFDRQRFPAEYAILQNNLATAFLSMPVTDERARIREALAVQCFEDALEVVNLIDHPVEYAMLQNNLGNALQYAPSSHPVENNVRALAAYDQALQVRSRANAPLEYANTIANKANCLWNLPDELERPEAGNRANLHRARMYYEEAHEIFASHGELGKAHQIAEALAQLAHESKAGAEPNHE